MHCLGGPSKGVHAHLVTSEIRYFSVHFLHTEGLWTGIFKGGGVRQGWGFRTKVRGTMSASGVRRDIVPSRKCAYRPFQAFVRGVSKCAQHLLDGTVAVRREQSVIGLSFPEARDCHFTLVSVPPVVLAVAQCKWWFPNGGSSWSWEQIPAPHFNLCFTSSLRLLYLFLIPCSAGNLEPRFGDHDLQTLRHQMSVIFC